MVNINIYNMRGQRVQHVERNGLPAGSHQWRWNARAHDGQPISSGVYFIRMHAETQTGKRFTAQQKVMFVK